MRKPRGMRPLRAGNHIIMRPVSPPACVVCSVAVSRGYTRCRSCAATERWRKALAGPESANELTHITKVIY